MIPYAILSGEITTDKDRKLDIRILELSNRHLTFRLPINYLTEGEKIHSVSFSFYQMEKRGYETIHLNSFQIRKMEREEFYDLYCLVTEEEAFHQVADNLTKEYLTYMDNRLYLEDAALSASMTSYPKDGDVIFADSMKEQMNAWLACMKDAYDEESFGGVSKLAYSLENEESIQKFLQEDINDFCKWYWDRYNLSWHHFAKLFPKRMIIGNPYCPCLFPDGVVIRDLFEKTKDSEIDIAFHLAPVSQSFLSKMKDKIDYIASCAHIYEKKITIYAGDPGIKDYIVRQHGNDLLCKDGVLMKKRLRDPRLSYLAKDHGQEWNSPLQRIEDGICLPYYQTNTATFCTLSSLCLYGRRDAYVRMMDCPAYCKDHFLIYPAHLNLLGRYNSIFGWNGRSLANGSDLSKRNEEWVVINL